MNTNELKKMITDYAIINEEKKAINAEVKDMGDEIKEAFNERGITEMIVEGVKAQITMKPYKVLNMEKVVAVFGRAIPDECYEYTQTVALNVRVIAKKGKTIVMKDATKEEKKTA